MKMRKRLSILLMLICCVFTLTACNGEKKLLIDPTVDTSKVELVTSQTENIYNLISIFANEDGMELLSNCNDDEVAYIFADFKDYMKIEDDVLVDGINSLYKAGENLGEITSADGIGDASTWDIKEDEVIVSYQLQGTKHDGYIEFIFDKNLHVTSVTTNVEYSTAELMKKAGTNTAIGMGTVFVMLIIISLIISLFRFIPKIQEAFQKKENKTTESVDKTITDIITREEDETDDLELVAVIAAAIAASEGASSTDGFVVRSIRRIR